MLVHNTLSLFTDRRPDDRMMHGAAGGGTGCVCLMIGIIFEYVYVCNACIYVFVCELTGGIQHVPVALNQQQLYSDMRINI